MLLQLTIWLFLLTTIALLIYPVGFVATLGRRGVSRVIYTIRHRIEEVRTLDTMRKDILKKRAEENAIGIAPVEGDDEGLETEDAEGLDTTDPAVIPNPEYDDFVEKKTQKLMDKIMYEAVTHKERWAIDLYEKKLIEGLAIDPDDMEFLGMLADLYFHTTNHKKAFTLLKKILDKDPQNHKVIWQIGEIYFENGELDTAELMIEKAIELMPNNPKYYVTMVEVKYNKNQKSEAINLMEKVVKLRPANISYIQALAEMYDATDDKQNAKKRRYKILEIEPNHDQAKKKLKVQ